MSYFQNFPEIPPPNPSGLCFCGCGEPAPIATQSDFRKGILRDYPMRFIHGHHPRQQVRYTVEDRGYKTPCWIWQLTIDDDGYGKVQLKGRPRGAHRAYYEEKFGPIPKGLLLDHLCRIRCCVNPDHLEPVTSVENTRRGLNAKLTPAEVIEIRRLLSEGVGQGSLAKRFGVTTPAISLIHRGKNWKGLEYKAPSEDRP